MVDDRLVVGLLSLSSSVDGTERDVESGMNKNETFHFIQHIPSENEICVSHLHTFCTLRGGFCQILLSVRRVFDEIQNLIACVYASECA